MSEKKTRTTRAPSYAEAYLCVVLVFGLVIGAMILGVPVQATMLFASVIATVFAYRLGYSWDVLEKAIAGKLGQLAPTVCILWLIGLYLGANMFTVRCPCSSSTALKSSVRNSSTSAPCWFALCFL